MDNLKRLQTLLKTQKIDFYLVPSNDEFMGEYTPADAKRLEFITGFTGSNGIALIGSASEQYFFTDGRYTAQAKQQLNKIFKILDLSEFHVILKQISASRKKIGACTKLWDIKRFTQLRNVIGQYLVELDQDLVDSVWLEKPKNPMPRYFIYPTKYAGQGTKEKIDRVKEFLNEKKLDSVVITDPHSICWLLNIRGNDLPYTPIILCYALVHKTGAVNLFLKHSYKNKELDAYLKQHKITVDSLDTFCAYISKLKFKKIALSERTPRSITKIIGDFVTVKDPIELMRAVKNKTEIAGAIRAHKKDAKAFKEFTVWLDKCLKNKTPIDELTVAAHLNACRAKQPGFVSLSFPPIVGFKSNGAIIHYQPSHSTNKKITGNGLLLIDSGGQYLDGTTDVTRVILIGKATTEQKQYYTRVLKGFLRLLHVKFPTHTTGAQLDCLARMDLWQVHADYAHGTGHGVGACLSVHEGPHGISKGCHTQSLLPGMIVSIEPGFYKEGEFGIRIESLVYVKHSSKKGFLEFAPLTQIPIEEKLIDFGMLSGVDKVWMKKVNKNKIIVIAGNPGIQTRYHNSSIA